MSNKPIVLQIVPEMSQGGVEVGTVEIAVGLQKEGIRNFVASSGGKMLFELDKHKVQHFTIPLKAKNPIRGYLNYLALKKIITENNINIVHARSRAPAWSAYFAAKACGVKFLTTFHGLYGTRGPGKKKYNRVMTKGRLIIAVSDYVKNHIVKNYNIAANKIRVIHRCVDLMRFDPNIISKERVIKTINEHNIPEDRKLILIVGRITRRKGHLVVIEALSKLKQNDYMCVIVGSDAGKKHYSDEIKEMVLENNLEDRVKFIGSGADIPVLNHISDIAISPSTEPEAFGRTTAEAQAMGCIVVASNHGGSLEIVDDGKTGKLFQNKDSDSLAQALDWALSLSDKEKEKISKAAIQNVKDNFSVDAMRKATIAVYNELLEMKD